MPFESYAQEAYLKHKHPSIYKRWVKKYGHAKNVNYKVNEKTKTKYKGK